MSICSPNYLHDAHVRFALRSRADAICEKPLVLNPWNIGGLEELERETGQNVFTILQLRLHPSIIALKEKIASEPKSKLHDVKLTYITSRGRWYFASWKGDEAKSGGIATNIGVHFYDMLSFVFGDLRENIVYHRAIDCAAGYLESDRARVHWFLSINTRDLPEAVAASRKTYRSITIDGEEIKFSDGFTDLHIASYQQVLKGRGFRLADLRPSIETVATIRTKDVDKSFDQVHPCIAKLKLDQHRCGHGWPV